MNKKNKPIPVIKMKSKEAKKSKEITPIVGSEIAKIMQAPEKLMSEAIAKGSTVETMERLLAMRRELKAEWAKEQYDIAMANFQGECPVIKKKKAGGSTKSGKVAYYYAPLDSIVTQVRLLLKKNNLSYAVKTETKDGMVKAICIAKHIAGHSESSDIELPLGTKTDIMSQTQVVASALTFAKRYSFCNIFGILTGDEDDDSNSVDKNPTPTAKTVSKTELASQSQKDLIVKLLNEKGGTVEALEQWTKKGKMDTWSVGVAKIVIDTLIKKSIKVATKDEEIPTVHEDDIEVEDDMPEANDRDLLYNKNEERSDI